ncbi:Uncharacterised protein [Mycobacteroides abscessus subsp. abscessus]|nr:Uncharacterised protein [Mycobacteroides abscessus subsp. abscessus]
MLPSGFLIALASTYEPAGHAGSSFRAQYSWLTLLPVEPSAPTGPPSTGLPLLSQ